MYVQYALDVWTVVDIYGMWIIGPRLCWGGFVDIMECLFFPLSWCLYVWCKRWQLLCLCVLTPWVYLPGNSNTLWGRGLVKEVVILMVLWLNMTTSALWLICWHWCSFQYSPPFSLSFYLSPSWCPQDSPVSSSLPFNQVTLGVKGTFFYKGTLKKKELIYANSPCFRARGAQCDSTRKIPKLTAGLAAGLMMMNSSGQRRSTFDHRC